MNYVNYPQKNIDSKTIFQNSFQNNSLVTLLSFILRYKIDRVYIGRACFFLLASLVEFPFSLYEGFMYGHQVESVELSENPIFIIGHWRSGTTHLQNLLSQDCQWATPTHMHVFYSRTFFTFERFRYFFESKLPKERGYDEVKVGLDVPEEEEEALLSYSPRTFYHAAVFPQITDQFFKRYALLEGVEQDELLLWQQDYLWFLKKFTLACQGRTLLLKNPVNTCRISALMKLFPKARFIHIYRNPYEVFQSNIKMLQMYRDNVRLQKLMPLEELKKGILERYKLMMEAFDYQRHSIPSHNLVEVSFEQIKDYPLESLNCIYAQLNLPNFENALPKFETYINAQKTYRQNVYSYTEEDICSVQQAWSKWIDRWDYQLPH
jgi:omega-hydroxy-beta-dihydromenaquinone-9 sulfotransferase